MPFNPSLWQRLTIEDTPIYIRKDKAEWFVPNKMGDQILRTADFSRVSRDVHIRRFLERLPQSPMYDYQGRGQCLQKAQLKELWFHITNRCNLTCSHCLFASGSEDAAEMDTADILNMADEAVGLGCKIFALTGGEPFIHKDIGSIIDTLLAYDATHVAVLTNGIAIRNVFEKHPHWDFNRFHVQISVDGLAEHHDRIRGNGQFLRLSRNLNWLKANQVPYTLSMCVDKQNVTDMPGIVDFAAKMGAANTHFMWYFVRGRGTADLFAPPDHIFEHLKKAQRVAENLGIAIDNIEGLKTQIFAPPGTIHDGTTAGWESAAVGPDGALYPSAALVGFEELKTSLENGLENAWNTSPVLEEIRHQSVLNTDHPLRFLLGGGDIDHSYSRNKTFMGNDPYLVLYEKLALHMITQELPPPREDIPQLRLKMGDILESCGAHGTVALLHSNCLLAMAQQNSLSVVKDFYHQAAVTPKEDILNPVCYAEDLISHIPEAFRFRGYGCGSPVADAAIGKGETIVDLGCGSGVECFIAAKMTGPGGRVFGIDMLDAMLEKAEKGRNAVTSNLGYSTIQFKKGYLERLPLDDNTADGILSNCVMNLSVNKRKAYAEILRVLKPGGRLVISDVVCDTEPDPAIRNDETLRGECIAGAMTQTDLMGLLTETGFEAIGLIKRFFYREVMGHAFYSLTYTAYKPQNTSAVKAMYRGPMAMAITSRHKILIPGQIREISKAEADALGDHVFILDDSGNVINIEMEAPCCCAQPPETTDGIIQPDIFSERSLAFDRGSGSKPQSHSIGNTSLAHSAFNTNGNPSMRHRVDCMKCGSPLTYLDKEQQTKCVFCGKTALANVLCEKGHFICDACHSLEAVDVITHICLETSKTDMVELFKEIRCHAAVPINGPEHHYMVPAIILAAYRNRGGDVTTDMIHTAIKRGKQVSGGYCGFMGVCGAAIGVGIAFSIILEANPVTPIERKTVQTITQKVLAEISKMEAARCCQRDAWIALTTAATLSNQYLPIPLEADDALICRQQSKNRECAKELCPLWPAKSAMRHKTN